MFTEETYHKCLCSVIVRVSVVLKRTVVGVNVLIVILLIYKQTCRGLRLKGNDHFAARDYHMAVACYSQAVMLR